MLFRATQILLSAGFLLFLLALVPHGAPAEVLAPPSLPGHALDEAEGGLSGSLVWLRLQRIDDGPARERHNYHLDLGGRFVLWQGALGAGTARSEEESTGPSDSAAPAGTGPEHRSAPRLSIEGEGRLMYQSEPPAPGSWLMDASAFVSDLTVRARVIWGGGSLGVFYRNDCKHDLDESSRRLVIHDALGVEAVSPILEGTYRRGPGEEGSPPDAAEAKAPRWAGWLSGRVELAAPILFEPADSPEPYRAGAYGQLDLEPLILRNGITLFSTLRAGARYNRDPFADEEPYLHMDYIARLGIRGPRREGHAALFVEAHRLHDDWITEETIGADTEPLHLLSIGLQLTIGTPAQTAGR